MTHSLLSITFILSFLGLIGHKLIWIGRSVSGENMQKRELKVISKELELSLDTFILKWLKVKLFLKRITYWFQNSKTVDMAGIFTIYINQFLICSFNKPDFSFSSRG